MEVEDEVQLTDVAKVPIQGLISEAYGRERAKLIGERAAQRVDAGNPNLYEGDTIYMTTADKDGNMVSLIQSNYRGMGSGVVVPGLGFVFQDRGQMFSLDPKHVNAFAPGKRAFNTIIPAFATKDGKPYISFGVMGGAMQPQGHVQVLINLVDYDMNLQEAGDAARINHEGGRQPTEGLSGPAADPLGTLFVEPGIPASTVERLRAMGHKVEVIRDGVMFGGYQAIARDPVTGVYTGATEMRKDGQASGY